MADLRRNLERQMLVSQVQRARGDRQDQRHRGGGAAPTTTRTRSEFTTPSEVTLREILIEVPATERGVNVAQDDEAKAKAEDDPQAAAGGEPFARLAADISDAPSKANGGLIGPIKRDELAPALQKLLDALKVGDITEVHAHHARLSDPQARIAHRDARSGRFDEARGDISDTRRRDEAARRAHEVPRAAPRAGDDHLAQRRAEEGLRAGAGASGTTAPSRDARRRREAATREPPCRRRSGSRSGRARATSRSSASSSSRSRSKRSCRRSPSGAAGRIARRRSTGRCFPATASRGSTRASGCRS